MRRFALPVLAAVSLAACSAAPEALADDRSAPRTLTVNGEGEAAGVPDIVILTLGVETEAKTAAAALRQNRARMNATIAKLEQLGVAERDMQTRNLSVNPRYDYSNDGEPPRIAGYAAQNMLTVKLRKLDEAGAIIDEVVSDGANRLGGLSFAFDDPKPLMNEARRAAVEDARARAALYAEAAGVSLGPILRISEGYAAAPSPGPVMEARAMKADSTPVAAGESSVSANVTIIYEIR